jgi:D-psicose/D-tagatose/L-ribulose 3-epimerase
MRRAICNELFGETVFSESLEIIRKTGFHGVEIAPHTLLGDFSGNVRNTVAEIRRNLNGEGLAFAGLHWLLVGPEGLHICSPDPTIRQKSWDHIRLLADIGGELGGGPLTLGSPAQRSSVGTSLKETMKFFTGGLSSVADHVDGTGCRLLVEALPSELTDVVNTLEEARDVIDGIGELGIGGMFDFHNTNDERDSWDELILSHRDYIAHVHLNDAGGIAPDEVTAEYENAFRTLTDISYDGWLSLEIFSVPDDPVAVLKQVADFIDDLETKGGEN